MCIEWGGRDNYQYEFIPEASVSSGHEVVGKYANGNGNNNEASQANFNIPLLHRKVSLLVEHLHADCKFVIAKREEGKPKSDSCFPANDCVSA